MYPLKKYNPDTILYWWASRSSHRGEDLQHVIQMGRTYYINPEDLTAPKVRRHIRALLYARNLLPTHRAPTDRDYDLARKRFRETWFDIDIV